MDRGDRQRTRTTATTVAAPDTPVPHPRGAPHVESAAPDITPVDTATVDTGPIPVVTAPSVGPTDDPADDTGPIPPVADPAPTAAPPAVPTGAAVTNPCRCGHGRAAHEHFRRGTDCAGCDCARFRRPGLLARLRGFARLRG